MDLPPQVPMYLETREDYENLRKNFPFKVWSKDFEALLAVSIREYCVATFPASDKDYEMEDGERVLMRMGPITWFPQLTREDREKINALTEKLEEYSYENIRTSAFIKRTLGLRMVRCYTIDGKKVYYIFDTQEVENSKIRKLGYTVDEVYELLLGVGEAEDELKENTRRMNEMTEEMLDKISEESGISKEELRKGMESNE